MLFRSAVRRSVAAALGFALVLAAATACAPERHVAVDLPEQVDAAFPDAVQTQLAAAVDNAMAATGSTGAIVGVWAPWSGSWVAGVGDAEVDEAFRVAEVTRPMTCDVLYQLAESKTVSLDDPVTDYVASIAGLPDQITLGSLCDGTSGLGSYQARLGLDFLNTPERQWNPNELAAYGIGSRDDSLIGTTYRDSDAAYVLLGLALEKATGRSAAELLADDVFGPLGMEATSLPSDAAAAPGDSALTGLLSRPGADGVLNCAEPTDVTVLSASMGYTNSGVVSTIGDLATYVRALATDALVPEDAGRFADPMPVGLDQPSWFTFAGGAFQAGSLIGQFGSAPGYLTAAFADPTTGLTVAVVLNNSAASENVGAYLAWELAAIASKAPAASGQTAPAAGLPWTAQNYHDAITALAVCPLPAS
ncbi:MAG: serine hydrolase [Microbacterium sp.]|uniref:serine hydrolase domain-containing protein n=1 Tax=Microbacterium sp. TaxID=51671 RepID=UPI002636781B|nr:serine hydrolase domain-containing protein [Microbacterium sp.]MCX6502981.1 serine hydrolase [Microbacterium sp.]